MLKSELRRLRKDIRGRTKELAEMCELSDSAVYKILQGVTTHGDNVDIVLEKAGQLRLKIQAEKDQKVQARVKYIGNPIEVGAQVRP